MPHFRCYKSDTPFQLLVFMRRNNITSKNLKCLKSFSLFFKSIELVTILLLFYALAILLARGMWDLGSLIMDRTLTPCNGRGVASIGPPGKSLKHFRIRPGQPSWVRADVHPLNAYRESFYYWKPLLEVMNQIERRWEKLSLGPVPAACTLG